MRYLPAYAKVNLTLEVLGMGPNGYHEISTVMQTIALHDLVGVAPAEATALAVTGRDAPSGGDNLVLRAQAALEQAAGRRLPAQFHLHKRIPRGAGLGGGSSDAAAALRGLPAAFALNVPPEVLHPCAAALGSDIPFLLMGGTAWASGRGDRIAPLPDVSPAWVVVAWPDAPVSTAAVYQAAGGQRYSDGRFSQALADRLRAGHPVSAADLHNDLEDVAAALDPAVAALRRRLRDAGDFRMTGTGGAFFAWCARREEAEELQRGLAGVASVVVATVPRTPA